VVGFPAPFRLLREYEATTMSAHIYLVPAPFGDLSVPKMSSSSEWHFLPFSHGPVSLPRHRETDGDEGLTDSAPAAIGGRSEKKSIISCPGTDQF